MDDLKDVSFGAAVCRICLCGEQSITYLGNHGEPLISPCLCRGTMGLYHQSCLQHWLSMNYAKSCEICSYEFITKEKVPSFLDYFLMVGLTRHLKSFGGYSFLMDFLMLVISLVIQAIIIYCIFVYYYGMCLFLMFFFGPFTVSWDYYLMKAIFLNHRNEFRWYQRANKIITIKCADTSMISGKDKCKDESMRKERVRPWTYIKWFFIGNSEELKRNSQLYKENPDLTGRREYLHVHEQPRSNANHTNLLTSPPDSNPLIISSSGTRRGSTSTREANSPDRSIAFTAESGNMTVSPVVILTTFCAAPPSCQQGTPNTSVHTSRTNTPRPDYRSFAEGLVTPTCSQQVSCEVYRNNDTPESFLSSASTQEESLYDEVPLASPVHSPRPSFQNQASSPQDCFANHMNSSPYFRETSL